MSDVQLIQGDCLDVLRGMESGSVDAVVTDPPAGIAFMGRKWDAQQTRGRFVDFLAPRLAECLRVARPGARMLCWALPRTSHWTATAIEDAGWLIEDRVSHIFGQGFPKAKSKLKPAMEDWYLARKPGGKVPDLNIDACRIGWDEASLSRDTARRQKPRTDITGNSFGKASGGQVAGGYDGALESPAGRWPATLCLSHHPACRQVGTKRVKGHKGYPNGPGGTSCQFSQKGTPTNRTEAWEGYAGPDGLETVAAWECHESCPVRLLDEMSGDRPVSGSARNGRPSLAKSDGSRNTYGNGIDQQGRLHDDSGGASRFFATFGYFPKASRRDRGKGNSHPTVKSQDLMRWLIRLICKPGDTLIDPFAGSGSTLLAALAEGVNAIGIEDDSEPGSFATAERRLAAARLPLGFG